MGKDLYVQGGKGVRLDSAADACEDGKGVDYLWEFLEGSVTSDPSKALEVVASGEGSYSFPGLVLFRQSIATGWGCETPSLPLGFQETPEESLAMAEFVDKLKAFNPEYVRKLTFGWFIAANYG